MRPPPRIARTLYVARRKPNMRLRPQHRAYIALLPCLSCGLEGRSICAHVRVGTDGGSGLKPSDRYGVPLCDFTRAEGLEGERCHDRQHRIGELTFWGELGLDPLDYALKFWTQTGDLEAGRRLVFRAQQLIALKRAAEERRS
jgi:hypothetical protein